MLFEHGGVQRGGSRGKLRKNLTYLERKITDLGRTLTFGERKIAIVRKPARKFDFQEVRRNPFGTAQSLLGTKNRPLGTKTWQTVA